MPENKTQQELATMCRAMEEMRNETVRERNIECALEMLADGMPYEKVAKYSKLTLEKVKALDNEEACLICKAANAARQQLLNIFYT